MTTPEERQSDTLVERLRLSAEVARESGNSKLASLLYHAADYLSRLPADWFQDSSLRTWFPFTADQLERQQKDIERLQSELAQAQRNKVEQARANQELMAQLIEARKDVARLDAAERGSWDIDPPFDQFKTWLVDMEYEGKTLRKAIDSAIAEQG